MKHLALAALAATSIGVLCIAPALAADQPRKPAIYTAAPLDLWSGPYAGIQLGRSRATADATVTIGGFSGSGTASENGWGYGLYSGYNWKSGKFVFGPEVELGTGKNTPISGGIRGRLGYLLTDYVLAYGAAGWQMQKVNFDTAVGNFSQNRSGFNLGAGLEVAMNSNWHARAEYVYSGLGSAGSDFGAYHADIDLRAHTVRAGLSYRF